MTDERPKNNRLAVFLLFGIALVAASGYAHHAINTNMSRQIFLAVLGATFAGVGIRSAQLLLSPRTTSKVLRPSDLADTKPTRVRRKVREAQQAEPRFFRSPPYFVDFQRSYVIRRPELDALVNAVTRRWRGVIVIEGPPAAGKSTLLRSLEYELVRPRGLRRRRAVTFLDLKTTPTEEIEQALAEVPLLPKRSVLFVDDAHLALLHTGRLLQECRSRDVLLVLATRPLSNYPAEQTSPIRDQQPEVVSIAAATAADGIIDRYLNVNGLEAQATEEIRSAFAPYRQDLWLLSAALRACEVVGGTASVSVDAIHQWVVANALARTHRGDLAIDRAHILAPLAALYRFEVPVARRFLIEGLTVDPAAVDALVADGTVLALTPELLTLHHSSLAQLMIGALGSAFGRDLVPGAIREWATDHSAPWEDAVLGMYARSVPDRLVVTLAGVGRASAAGRSVASEVVGQLDDDLIVRSIDLEHADVESLGTFLDLWRTTMRPLPEAARQRVLRYADGRDGDPRAWAWATANLALVDPDAAARFADVLASLLRTSPAPTAADIGTTLSYVSPSLARRAVATLDPVAVTASLDQMGGLLQERAKVMAKLVWVNPSLAAAFPGSLLEMFPVPDAEELASLTSRLAWGNAEVACQLLDRCETELLATLIRDAPPPSRYCAIATLANVGVDSARDVLRLGLRDWEGELGVSKLADVILSPTVTEDAVHVWRPESRPEPAESASPVEAILRVIAGKDAHVQPTPDQLGSVTQDERAQQAVRALMALDPDTEEQRK